MSQSLFGFRGKDFCILAADASAQASIVVIKDNLDRIFEADDHFAFGCVGDPGDDTTYSDLIVRNIQLQKFRNGYTSTSHANANFMRKLLHDGLRDHPYNVNIMIGAVDLPSDMNDTTTERTELMSSSVLIEGSNPSPHLYYLDYLGTLVEVPFAAHGYCAYLLYGILDEMWKKDMSVDEAKRLLSTCIKMIQKRFVMQQPKFICKIITKDGIELIEPLNN
ncbi:putative Proteasome subunit beta type-2 [Blattamonas nauphoetae]|uniref:Proteasome subunit beta n=1 Tax=Blattamonas nauphoetae TaxID=2049346 RepID=A0ABQ9XNM0_9EUKA|nr:putative Proteasome subunit beta type-2 [Blattamonas nauphoetae]